MGLQSALVRNTELRGTLLLSQFSLDVDETVEEELVRLEGTAEFFSEQGQEMVIKSQHPVLSAVLHLYEWSLSSWEVTVERERRPFFEGTARDFLEHTRRPIVISGVFVRVCFIGRPALPTSVPSVDDHRLPHPPTGPGGKG